MAWLSRNGLQKISHWKWSKYKHDQIYKLCQSLGQVNSVLEVAVFKNVGKKLLTLPHEWFGVWLELTLIHSNNLGSLAIAENSRYHKHTKHFNIKHHFIRDQIKNETVQLKYCPTSEMTADIFTKVLPWQLFTHHCDTLNVSSTWGGVLRQWSVQWQVENLVI